MMTENDFLLTSRRHGVAIAAFKCLQQLEETITKHMSDISDELATITANLASVATGIANLDTQIQTLTASLAAEGNTSVLSPADQATLDAIKTASASLAAAANAAVTPAAAAPAASAPPASAAPAGS